MPRMTGRLQIIFTNDLTNFNIFNVVLRYTIFNIFGCL